MKAVFLSTLTLWSSIEAFTPSITNTNRRSTTYLNSDARIPIEESSSRQDDDESEIQWDLFKKHHAKGSYKGLWTSYNYIGDVVDEVVASVNLDYDEENDTIEQSHTIVVGATKADCATCFDTFETKVIPVAKYTSNDLRKIRLGSIGMVSGPTLMRSGAMATELILSHGDGRIRVVFQHAPVWAADVEPGSGPPSGLKLFRTLVSREALRDEPPTFESETATPPTDGNPTFSRGVPPFTWHKEWAGTSWTWGPQAGNKGWQMDRMEEADAWHGRPTGDGPNVWNLRLPGGILLHCPRVVSNDEAGIFRLAWMPTEETLVRMEVSIMALQPMIMEDETLVGFYPPSLGSLRCDTMTKIGDLPDLPRFIDQEKDTILPKSEEELKLEGDDSAWQ
eukprot:CAMPEP_0194137612 /NCGR_PEP_ID=MMETSP0152-20130528/7487_1 /TAXON_ID=1049557 /ORGANISM="Thalassiothrix antarctica, Strain L6-D1" /LENGTH=392 /DNA_ID=CAMNT_0038834711 /DNA_START=15 /DNA_END=1193 /DNA_ORIENTATION=-